MEKKKILFIDDDDFFINLYRTKLVKEGIQFLSAKNGKEGIEKIKEEKPSLVVTEITLPGKGGFKVIEEMKRNDETAGIPVIILTTLSGERDREDGKRYEAEDYFVKSEIGFSEIVERIKEIINL